MIYSIQQAELRINKQLKTQPSEDVTMVTMKDKPGGHVQK